MLSPRGPRPGCAPPPRFGRSDKRAKATLLWSGSARGATQEFGLRLASKSSHEWRQASNPAPFQWPAPIPHTEHRLLIDGVAECAGRLGDLTAMMGFVADEVSDEVSTFGLKSRIRPSSVWAGFANHGAQRRGRRFERLPCTGFGERLGVDLGRHITPLLRGQPHQSNIVNVGEELSDVGGLARRQGRRPCCIGDGLEQTSG